MERKTPLYDVHVEEGGKIVPFAGYLLPVQYKTGVIKEHMAVREQAGLFDVSHMGEIKVSGPTATATINHLITNDCSKMTPGKVIYSFMCYEDGGAVDDLLVYKYSDEEYLTIVNASNREKDFEHMKKNALEGTVVEDLSDDYSQIAIQGPNAIPILESMVDKELLPQKYYTFVPEIEIAGIKCLISRTGYTGERGYEIYAPAEAGPILWKELRKAGEPFGLIPCGLGARDTLRFEAGMPLYGHEMNETITPLEVGLDFCVKMGKEEFIGKQALIDRGTPKNIRVGLEVTGRGIVREHQDIYVGDKKIGISTSGTHSPFYGKALAMARIEAEYAEIGTEVTVDVRGKRVEAKVVELPFYPCKR